MNWKVLTLAITDTLKTTAMVMVLVTGAVVFGRFLAVTRLPYVLVEVIGGMDVPRVAILAVVILIYIFGGMVMDSLGFLTLSIPIFFPLLMKLNYDPVWFVVMFCIITTMGAVTPPVGLNAFIVKGLVPEVPLERIFKGIGIFIAAYLIDLILMIAFPQIITGLPMLLS